MTSLKKKNTNENLLKAISFLRLQFTYEELGDKLGYTKATVSKYLSEKQVLPPSDDFLNKFEEVFNVKLSDFDSKPIKQEAKNPTPSGDGFFNSQLEKIIHQKDVFLDIILKDNERLRNELDLERSKNNKI